jgi:hypothetical protein
MAAMLRDDVFVAERFSCLDNLRELWDEAQIVRPDVSKATSALKPEHEMLIDQLREIGLSYPNLAYVYIRHVMYHSGSYSHLLPKEFVRSKLRGHFSKDPTNKIIKDTESQLVDYGFLTAGKSAGAYRLASPHGGEGMSPQRDRVNQVLLAIRATPPGSAPSLEAEW